MRELARDRLQWLGQRWYTLFVALLLVLRVFFWFSPSHGEKINIIYLWPGVIAASALVIGARRERLPQGFGLTLGMAAWLLFSCVVNGDPYLEYNRVFFLGIVTCFVGCFVAVPMAGPQGCRGALRLLAGVYVALMALMAALGIYATVTGTAIRTPFSQEAIHAVSFRLTVFQYKPTEVGSAFVLGFLLALYLALSSGGILSRLVWAAGALILFAGVAATLSMTALGIASAGCGLCAFWAVYRALRAKGPWLRRLAALALLLGVAAAAYCSLAQTANWLHAAGQRNKAASGTVAVQAVPAALASSARPTAPKAGIRAQSGNAAQSSLGRKNLGTVSGRTQIWQAALDYLRQHPRTLLLGVPDNVVSRIPVAIGRPAYHLHNAFLEMLLLGGLPGLALYLGFLFVLFRQAFRLAFAKTSPVSHKFLAMIPLLMTCNGLAEIYPLFSGNVVDMMYFVLAGGVIVLGAEVAKVGPEPPAHDPTA